MLDASFLSKILSLSIKSRQRRLHMVTSVTRQGRRLFFFPLLIKLSSSSSSSFERAIIFFLGRLQHGKPPNSSPPYMRQPPYSVRNICFMREIGQHDWQSSTTSLAPSQATAYRSPSVHPNPYHPEKVLSVTKFILCTS